MVSTAASQSFTMILYLHNFITVKFKAKFYSFYSPRDTFLQIHRTQTSHILRAASHKHVILFINVFKFSRFCGRINNTHTNVATCVTCVFVHFFFIKRISINIKCLQFFVVLYFMCLARPRANEQNERIATKKKKMFIDPFERVRFNLCIYNGNVCVVYKSVS